MTEQIRVIDKEIDFFIVMHKVHQADLCDTNKHTTQVSVIRDVTIMMSNDAILLLLLLLHERMILNEINTLNC